jgi:hypothetical protein
MAEGGKEAVYFQVVTMRWTPLHSRGGRGSGGKVLPNFTNKGSSVNGHLSGRY